MMKIILAVAISALIFISACKEKSSGTESGKEFTQLIVKEDSVSPTIDIKSFTLITNNAEAEMPDAKEIMQLKRKAPLAMQKKDRALFNEMLAEKFTYRAEDEFYKNRQEFINNRLEGQWTVASVKYENLVMQIFGDVAILTYRNIVKGTDDFGRPDTEYYCWADFYFKEKGKWKAGGSHRIDQRIEYTNK